MVKERGPMCEAWVETHSGALVSITNPQPEQFDIKDIAYALSNICRFNGHAKGWLSVAEHCVTVSHRLPPEKRLAGLMHDVAEAYLGDIPSPIKQFLPDYKAIEKRFEAAIEKRFGVTLADPDIKAADKKALFTEAHFLIPSQGKDWTYFNGPEEYKVEYEFKPMCFPPAMAYKLFLGTYEELTGQAQRIIVPAA